MLKDGSKRRLATMHGKPVKSFVFPYRLTYAPCFAGNKVRQDGNKVKAISSHRVKQGFNQVAFIMRGFESIFLFRKKDGVAFN